MAGILICLSQRRELKVKLSTQAPDLDAKLEPKFSNLTFNSSAARKSYRNFREDTYCFPCEC